jgi:hypothetical protein
MRCSGKRGLAEQRNWVAQGSHSGCILWQRRCSHMRSIKGSFPCAFVILVTAFSSFSAASVVFV